MQKNLNRNKLQCDKTKCLNYFSKCNKEMKSMIDCNNETQWGQLGFIHCCKTCFKITRKWKREERKRRINERKPKGNSGDVDTPKKDNTPKKDGTPKKDNTPKEDGTPKKDNTPNCKNYPLSNNGRCGCRFKTFCKSGFCSRWGWCGPGNDARDKNGASWEDPTTYNHKYSAKFVPKECLDIPKEDETPKGDDTPKDNDVPKEDETPKEDDTPKDNDVPKEDDTPKGDDTPKDGDAPKEDDDPKDDDTENPNDKPDPTSDEPDNEDEFPEPEEPESPDYKDWGFDNIHGMPKIQLDFTPIRNRIESNSKCSKTEVDQIMKGIQMVKPWIDKSYADWDKNLHQKWFGTVKDSGLSDRQVFHRFKRAYDFMYEDDPRWEVMCCDQAIGGCTSCQRGVLAYVTYWYTPGNRDSHRKNVNIRLCPTLFNTEDATEVIGITMFHEVMHITSHAGDSCYSKKDCYNLARTNPSKARLNANSYTLFAIEGGAPRDDYERLMDLWGGSVLKEGCSDYRYNCWEMAKKYKCEGNYAWLKEQCCSSCHHVQDSGKLL